MYLNNKLNRVKLDLHTNIKYIPSTVHFDIDI